MGDAVAYSLRSCQARLIELGSPQRSPSEIINKYFMTESFSVF